MQIGVFGGTFDPIHIGHLRAAQEVCEGFPLDRCYLVPSASPPHKEIGVVADVTDRLVMTRMAADPFDRIEVSDVEVRRTGPSYTIETIEYFLDQFESDTRLFLLVGIDAFLEFHTWKSNRTLLRRSPIIVLSRPDPDVTEPPVERVGGYLARHYSERYTFDPDRQAFDDQEYQSVHIFSVSLLDIASSQIRRCIAAGLSIRFLVPEAVETYIREKRLYR